MKLMPIIIGSSGMIRAETQQHFAALGLTAAGNLSLMQEHHGTAIRYFHQILQDYRVLPPSPPTPKPRRAPKLKHEPLEHLFNPMSHKRALPATASVLTRSMKHARTDCTLCQHPSASSSPAPSTARSWGRLIFTVGRTTGSTRRVKRRTRPDHNKDRGQDSTLRPSLPRQHDARPHTAVSPPALLGSNCSTTSVQAPAKRARRDSVLQCPSTATESKVSVNVYRSPPIANESPWPQPRSLTRKWLGCRNLSISQMFADQSSQGHGHAYISDACSFL